MDLLFEKQSESYHLLILDNRTYRQLTLIVDMKKGHKETRAAILREKSGAGQNKPRFKTKITPLEKHPNKMQSRAEASTGYESLKTEPGEERYEPLLEYFSTYILPALGTDPEKTVYIMDLGFGAGRINRYVSAGKFDAIITKDPKRIGRGAGLILSGGACRDWGCKGDLKCFMEKAGTELRQKVLEYAEKGRPVLGICMGHLLINYFLGGGFKAPREEEFEERDRVHYTKKALALMQGIPDGTKMQYYHRGEITKVSTDLDVAGFSHHLQPENMFPQGGPAIFVHKEKPIYSVFFHPEYSGDRIARIFYGNFLKLCEELN